MTKQEREAEALRRRQEEADAIRKRNEELRKKHEVLNKGAEQIAAREERDRERERRERERDRHRRDKDESTDRPNNSSKEFLFIAPPFETISSLIEADEEREEAAVKERYLGIIKVNERLSSKKICSSMSVISRRKNAKFVV